MKTYWGNGGVVSRIINLGTRWPTLTLKKKPNAHLLEGSVDPRAGLGTAAKTKNPFPTSDRYQTSAVQPIA